MARIYLIVDDCPREFGGWGIISAYFSKRKAKKKIEEYKNKDSYAHQYYTMFKININDGPNYNIERKKDNE